MTNDRLRWDTRYRDGKQPGAPASLLCEWLPALPNGRALDLACGTGANTLALAQRGCAPMGIDISPVGLQIAACAARKRGLGVDWLCADLSHYPLPAAAFDVICVFRFLDRDLTPAIVRALKPGGWLIYQTFTVDQLGWANGPHNRAFLLDHGELLQRFKSLRVLHYTEQLSHEQGRAEALASLVARHP